MRPTIACLLSCLAVMLAAREDPAGAAVPCAVEGGACAPGMLCVHVCDCCGIDAGVPPAGHDTCVPDTNQCEALFQVEGRTCQCNGSTAGEAWCPCA